MQARVGYYRYTYRLQYLIAQIHSIQPVAGYSQSTTAKSFHRHTKDENSPFLTYSTCLF